VIGLITLDERRTTFAKTYGIKMRCYWELFALNPPFKKKKKNMHEKSIVHYPISTPNTTRKKKTHPPPLPPHP